MKKLSIRQRTDTPEKRIEIYKKAILKYNSAPLHKLIGLGMVFEKIGIDIYHGIPGDSVFGTDIKFLPELESFSNNPGKSYFKNDFFYQHSIN